VTHHYTCPGHQALAEEQERFAKDSDGRALPGQFAYFVPTNLAAAVIDND
jgi:hypothetical protein